MMEGMRLLMRWEKEKANLERRPSGKEGNIACEKINGRVWYVVAAE